jgi:hypothetical protein
MQFTEIVGCPEANRAQYMIETSLTLEIRVFGWLTALGTNYLALPLVKDLVFLNDIYLVLPSHQSSRTADGSHRDYPVVALLDVQVQR